MEKEIEIISIDDKNYGVIKEVNYKNISYLYLSNINDEEDSLIRKTNIENKNIVEPLKDEQEFELACNLLFKDLLNEKEIN